LKQRDPPEPLFRAESVCDTFPRIHADNMAFIIMSDEEALRRKLGELRSEHSDLDDVIDRFAQTMPYDQLKLQRLKKRRLVLKDLIAKLESRLVPDIIA
jgi:hypothetical protein